MKRKPLILLLSIFSALIIGVGAWALGYLLRDILMPADTAMAVLIALVCVLIVAAVVSTVLFFKNKKQMENLKVEEINK